MASYGNNVTSSEVYNMFNWKEFSEEEHRLGKKQFTTRDKNKYLLKNAPSQLWMRNDVNTRPAKEGENGNKAHEMFHYRDADPTPFARVDRTTTHAKA